MHGRLVKNLFIDNHRANFTDTDNWHKASLDKEHVKFKLKKGQMINTFIQHDFIALLKLVSCKGHVNDVTQGTLVIKNQLTSYQDHIIIIILALSK